MWTLDDTGALHRVDIERALRVLISWSKLTAQQVANSCLYMHLVMVLALAYVSLRSSVSCVAGAEGAHVDDLYMQESAELKLSW